MKKLLPKIHAIALIFPNVSFTVEEMPPHKAGMTHLAKTMNETMPTEGGQSAFAAIQEIVGMLEADSKTDWSKVDIEALRQYLIDMDNVTLRSAVKVVEAGDVFTFSVQVTWGLLAQYKE